MTAEKPEGDVALLQCPSKIEAAATANLLRGDFAYDSPVPEIAADMLESQATRIATLSEALELIAEASYLDGARLIARRALSQGEAK